MWILDYNWFELFDQYWSYTDLELRTKWTNTIWASYNLGCFVWFLVAVGVALLIYGIVKFSIWAHYKLEEHLEHKAWIKKYSKKEVIKRLKHSIEIIEQKDLEYSCSFYNKTKEIIENLINNLDNDFNYQRGDYIDFEYDLNHMIRWDKDLNNKLESILEKGIK